MDFTLKTYRDLLLALQASGINFRLRHDVDLKPLRSLRTAKLENQLGIKATYYFRTVPQSFNPEIIKQIHSLEHTIGYHYESLTTTQGNIDAAYKDFCINLNRLRALAPINTICMHGSPRSPYDSRDIWKKYDYHTLDIDYEPYFDTDYNSTLYLTDTGRRWDGYQVSVRDKIPQHQEKWQQQGLSYHSTPQIIAALLNPASPLRCSGLSLLITTHPQRWTNPGLAHLSEFTIQTIKNIVKRLLILHKNKNNSATQ
jgi:hypothetical protein